MPRPSTVIGAGGRPSGPPGPIEIGFELIFMLAGFVLAWLAIALVLMAWTDSWDRPWVALGATAILIGWLGYREVQKARRPKCQAMYPPRFDSTYTVLCHAPSDVAIVITDTGDRHYMCAVHGQAFATATGGRVVSL